MVDKKRTGSSTREWSSAGPLEAVLADEMRQVRKRLAEARAERTLDVPATEAEQELVAHLHTLERGIEATHHRTSSGAVPAFAGDSRP